MSPVVAGFTRFSRLFQEPMLLVSTSGHLCAANPAAYEILLPNTEITSTALLFDFIENAREQVLEYLKACSRSADPLPGRFAFPRAESPYRTARCVGCAFQEHDDHQRPLVVLRFISNEVSSNRFIALNQQLETQRTEIARRLAAEREAQRQRELLHVTLSSIGDAVIATDVRGRITFMNPVAAELTGRSSTEALGRSIDEVFVIRNEFTNEPVASPVTKVLQEGVIVGLANHTVLVRPDGTQIPIDDSGAPIRDNEGLLFGVILVFHDVSERRHLQRQLFQKTDALQEANRRKDEFLAVLAHELRNPLAPLRSGLQIARLKIGTDETLRRTVEMMERQLAHLVRLVDDLMDVSRVTRGAIELRRAPVLVADVLARSIESVRADLEARSHELSVHLPKENIAVEGDADRLTQVFCNLLANSAKYSPDNGRIGITAASTGTEVLIEVRDQGIGIPPEYLDRVFDMFSQVRFHQGRSEGGLGIGLALVKTLVEMHGGRITVSSEGSNRGSAFTVRLPLLLSVSPLVEHRPVLSYSQGKGNPLKILVVDNNRDAAESLCSVLEMIGQRVAVAFSGPEALRSVENSCPDLIFMDIGMPEMDGLQAIRLIRQRPDSNGIFIAALTGWGQSEDRERSREAGADRHLVKPLNPEQMAEVIAAAQEKRL